MSAATATAVTAISVIFFCEDKKTIFNIVVLIFDECARGFVRAILTDI